MRKYEDVDVIAALGVVVELNTEHYKSDFKYDIECFKEAVRNPDGDNNRLLWMSRQSGTWCVKEREAFIKDSEAYNIWNSYATVLGDKGSNLPTVIVQDRILAFAVEIKGIESGKIKGNLHELDYRDHIRHLNRVALPLHTVDLKYKDGTALTLLHKDYSGKHMQLYHQHGQLLTVKYHPEDAGALRDILTQMREKREKEARPAVFKLRTSNKKPSIRAQLAEGKAAAATPKKAVAKSKTNDLEV